MGKADVNDVSQQKKLMAARLSLGSNLLLLVTKLAVGVFSHSISVLSEGAHSATDLLASAIALYTIRMSARPPDAGHPFGHGKAENLSGLAEAIFLITASITIFYEAAQRLVNHVAPERLGLGMLVMGVSALVNAFVARIMFRVAIETDSQAIKADAQNHRADIYTAAGVFIGLALVALTRIGAFDSVLALLVGLVIARESWIVGREAIAHLMDHQLPEGEIAEVQRIFDTEPGMRAYHKLRTRKAGHVRHVDAHILLDDDLTLVEAHAFTEGLEAKVRDALPNTVVTLHTEPFQAEEVHQREVHGGPPADERKPPT